MSLLDSFGKACTLLVKTQTPDGEGGFKTAWTDGEAFTLYPALDSSLEARRAEQEGVTSVYTALVAKTVGIAYGDYYRCDGTTYRVTSNPAEKEAPACAGSVIRALKYFTAERKELPK